MDENIAFLFQDKVHGFVVSVVVWNSQDMDDFFILL